MARILKRYGIRPATYRPAGLAAVKGYHQTDFKDAFSRYLETSGNSVTTDSKPHDEVASIQEATSNNNHPVTAAFDLGDIQRAPSSPHTDDRVTGVTGQIQGDRDYELN